MSLPCMKSLRLRGEVGWGDLVFWSQISSTVLTAIVFWGRLIAKVLGK